MESRDLRRLWTFSVTDYEDHESYVDADGKEINYSDAATFVGTHEEAVTESERRANAWEERKDACCAKVTHHSMGVVK